MPSLLLRIASRLAGLARPFQPPEFRRGLLAGCGLLAVVHQFTATFGSSARMVVASALTIAAATSFALRSRTPAKRHEASRSLLLLSLWTLVAPWLCGTVLSAAGLFSADTLASAPAGWAFAAGAACLLVPPAYWASRSVLSRAPAIDAGRAARGLSGAAVGLLLAATILAPLWDLALVAWVVAALASAGFVRAMLAGNEEPEADAHPNTSFQTDGAPRLLATLWLALAIAACGAAYGLLSRLVDQVLARSAFLSAAEWAGLLAGVAAGLAWQRRQRGSQGAHAAAWPCLVTAAWPAVILGAFPLLVELVLALNASLTSVAAQVAARSLLVGGIAFPLGLAWGRTGADGLRPLAFAAGLCLVPLGIPLLGLANLVTLLAGASLLLALAAWLPRRPRRAPWWQWAAAATAAGLACASPWLQQGYQPDRATRLLFSTQVLLAGQAGEDARTLQVLDEARPVARSEGAAGTYTVWLRRSHQYTIRLDGIPRGIVSARPDVCPQYAPAVLAAAMPLTLHESPRRVLVLGLGGSVPLTTSLAFAVQELTCFEPDAALLKLFEETIWPACGGSPLTDPRVRLVRVDPVLAVAAGGRPYDVIISTPDHAARAGAAACYTREFYRRVADRLGEGGIFCQAFQTIDYGAAPLQTAARTMREAFSDVVFLETAPGEILLLGTNSPAGLARPGLVERLQLPQVRQSLAQAGWDWSIPLNLAAWNGEALAEIAREESLWKRLLCRLGLAEDSRAAVAPNTIAGGAFRFRLPYEVMRWAPKPQEVAALLGPRTSRFAAWGDVDPTDPDLLQRLAEVTGQARLMSSNPDQHWDYRQVLREQLRSTTRSKIIQVRGETLRHDVHPEDRRRMAYFSALGRALQGRPVDPQDVQRIEAFTEPYDPLVSYFLHQEVAELYQYAQPRDVRKELEHRLHAIYYGHAADRSVRDVAEALRLVAEHPEASESPTQRRDHLDALLQAMKARWEARSAAAAAPPQVLLIDIEKTLSALEVAFRAMNELDRELDLEGTDWPARQAFLERSLIRPLRTYRAELLPHHRRERDKQASLEESAFETDEPALPPSLLPDELQ